MFAFLLTGCGARIANPIDTAKISVYNKLQKKTRGQFKANDYFKLPVQDKNKISIVTEPLIEIDKHPFRGGRIVIKVPPEEQYTYMLVYEIDKDDTKIFFSCRIKIWY
jgi:hypothetical protein